MAEHLIESTYKAHSKMYKDLIKSFRRILVTLINTMPKEELIKVLNEKKIIKIELNEATGNFEPAER